MSIVDVLEESLFELGIEISVSDATNLIRLVEKKFTSTNKDLLQFLNRTIEICELNRDDINKVEIIRDAAKDCLADQQQI